MGRLKMAFTLLTVLILSLNYRALYTSCFKDISIKILMILIGYMIINYLYLFIPSDPSPPGERIVKIADCIYPFIILSIVVMEIKQRRANILFSVIIFAYYCWMLALLFFTKGNITTSSRLGIEGIDGNDFAFVTCLVIFLLYIKCSRFNLSISKAVILSLIPLTLLIFTASRTAFGCLTIILAVILIDQGRRINAKKFMLICSLFVIGGCGYFYIIENTKLGERLTKTTTQGKDKSLETGTFVDVLGDRGPFYYFGFLEFQKEPIHGIGLTNFGKKAVWGWYRHSLILHSEYMVQLCECGIIGLSLFLTFLFSLWHRIKVTSSKYIPISKECLYCAFTIPAFIAFFFWTYDRVYIFILYGVIIGYISLSDNIKRASLKSTQLYESTF